MKLFWSRNKTELKERKGRKQWDAKIGKHNINIQTYIASIAEIFTSVHFESLNIYSFSCSKLFGENPILNGWVEPALHCYSATLYKQCPPAGQPSRVMLLLGTLSSQLINLATERSILHRKVYAPSLLPWSHPNTDNWLITPVTSHAVLSHPFKFLYSAVYFSRHLWHQPYITSFGSPAWKTDILTVNI